MRSIAVLATMLLAASEPAGSAPLTVSDADVSITVDGETQDGLFNWIAGGADQLSQQWIWFRQGTTAERSLDTLGLDASSAVGNQIILNYTAAVEGFTFEITYTVTDGSQPRIDEQILVSNTMDTDNSLTLLLYSDIDVNAAVGTDLATGGVAGISQTSGGATVDVTPLSITPDAFQIAFFPDLLDSLNDGITTNLDGSGSGLGPADLTHAFQWDLSFSPGEALAISVAKEFTAAEEVPGPPSLGLLLGELLVVAGILLRRGRNGGV
jgi:hypothetical protein